MSLSTEQLDAFHRFATSKLADEATDLSLEDLLRMWRTETECLETIEAVKQGIADIEAGRCHTIDEVDAEIRQRFEQLREIVPEESK